MCKSCASLTSRGGDSIVEGTRRNGRMSSLAGLQRCCRPPATTRSLQHRGHQQHAQHHPRPGHKAQVSRCGQSGAEHTRKADASNAIQGGHQGPHWSWQRGRILTSAPVEDMLATGCPRQRTQSPQGVAHLFRRARVVQLLGPSRPPPPVSQSRGPRILQPRERQQEGTWPREGRASTKL